MKYRRAMLRKAVMMALLLATAGAARAQNAVPKVDGPLGLVNVMHGTKSLREFSHGNTLPLVGPPFAMTDWSVQNRGELGERWFYHSDASQFVGFRATHQPCPWAGDFGHFTVTPQTGPVALRANERSSKYDPAQTTMRPDYVRVMLENYNVTAELTSSERAGVMRLTFAEAETTGRLIFDVAGAGDMKVENGKITGTARFHGNSAPNNFATYFVVELDRPVTASRTPANRGRQRVGFVEFDVSDKPTVEVKIATSYISHQQAELNLKRETSGGFDVVRERTAKAWADALSRITVDGTDKQEATFYTNLYRALKYPQKLYELDTDSKPTHYSPWDGKVHAGFAYTNSGLWDTFRTQMPFLALVYPEQYGEIVNGWLNAYKEGGWLPMWPSPGGFRGMPGSHADAMIADAMVKGIKGFDYDLAYEALRKDAFDTPTRGKPFGGRPGVEDYLRLGYVPIKSAEYWVSMTLDYAYDDWCVAQAAKLVGKQDDHDLLMKRAQNYRKLYDPSVGFMRGKDRDGKWAEPFDEFAWGGAYTECGPWQASWAVQHDAAGLAETMGGRDAFIAKLDKLFDQPSTFHIGGYNGEIHEMTEFARVDMGQYAQSNQPSFHIPFLYAAAGQPWKTEKITRTACEKLFGPGPDGMIGDDDNGSMAAWYLFSSIGLYPLTPGTPQYVLTSPVFDSVTINLPGDKTLKIVTDGNSPANVYVQSRTLNGKPLTRTFVTHDELKGGATITTQMSDQPIEREVKNDELPYAASPW